MLIKISRKLISLSLALSAVVISFASNSYADDPVKEIGGLQIPQVWPGQKIVADLSHHQGGQLDFEELKRLKVDGAVIRIGYGDNLPDQHDRYFIENVAKARKANMPIAFYSYSYATTGTEARSEADHALWGLREVDAPAGTLVFWDTEKNKHTEKLDKETLTGFALTWAGIVREAGYKPGVYANKEWFTTHLDLNQLFSNPDSFIYPWLSCRDTMAPQVNDMGSERFAECFNIKGMWQFCVGEQNNLGNLVGSESGGIDFNVACGDVIRSGFWQG
jgi:hypothetical protein